ncbi:MAG TPA: T9SS type A sorting domain-containing protein [Paludibacteraceae bacterium]|nr:T9SS type A sorting domain-containing protein [Paludibacteraceae bacterium]
MKTLNFLLLTIVTLLLSFSTSFGQSDCLIAWYKLDGNAFDNSGNNNNGILTGATPTSDRWGNANSALKFNGIYDKVDLPGDFDFPERTISVWFKTNSFPTSGAWIYDSDHSNLMYGHTQIYVISESGINKISLCVGYNTSSYTFDNALTDTWYHAAIVVNENYVKYFINGALIDSVPNNDFAHSSDGDNFAKIGTTRKNDRFFDGAIDDVRIYNCALSDEEIQTLYTYGNDCIYAWYKLDGNAFDYSGNNNNGILTGATPTSDRWGNANSALKFNGIYDKVDLPGDFDFPERTISVWFKTNSFPTSGAWIYDSDHSNLMYGHTQIYVISESGINKISLCVGYNTSSYTFDNALTDTWYHAAIVVNENYVKYFINGALIDSVPNTNFAHSVNGDSFAKIGTTRNNDRFFDGVIDEVRIYNCAISNAEIDSLYDINVLINKIITVNGLSVYPNPASNYITVAMDVPEESVIEILNIESQLIKKMEVKGTKSIIDISNFPNGIYIIKATTDNGIITKKFIKD